MLVKERNNVRLTGNPDSAKTLVFAHGFGNDQTAWHEVAAAFADEYRILLFDYVGANAQTISYFTVRKYKQLSAFADDILDILDEFDLRDITFIGHSVGGMSGALAAVREPDLFSRLVLLNASPRYLNDDYYMGGFDPATLDDLFARMKRDFHAWASGFAPLIMANPDRPHLATGFVQSISAMRPDVALAIAKLIFYSDHRADITRLKHPTLLVQARNDVAVPPEVGYYMEKHMPNAQLTFVESDGHLPHISDPDKVIRAIRPFL